MYYIQVNENKISYPTLEITTQQFSWFMFVNLKIHENYVKMDKNYSKIYIHFYY